MSFANLSFAKFKSPAILAIALTLGACPLLAQTTQEQTTSTTTTSTSGPDQPVTAHQLKKDEKADKAQAKADKAHRKLVKSGKMHNAEDKQAQADNAADRANNPNR